MAENQRMLASFSKNVLLRLDPFKKKANVPSLIYALESGQITVPEESAPAQAMHEDKNKLAKLVQSLEQDETFRESLSILQELG